MAGQPDGFRLGLAVLLRGGLAAWMQAWASTRADTIVSIPASPPAPPVGGRADDVVAVLTAMALACTAG